MVNYYIQQNKLTNLEASQSFVKVFQEQLANPRKFISSLYKTMNNFRNPSLVLNCLDVILESYP